jgi:hypothetical protein
VYESGAEFDTSIGRLCKPPTKTIITAENSAEYYRRRVQLKQERLMLGAAEYLAKRIADRMPDDGDVLQAIGYTAMQRADNTDSKNTKQIDAAKLIINEGGYGEDKNAQQMPTRINMFVMPNEVAQFILEIKRRLHSESDISASNDSADSRVIDTDTQPPPTDQEPGT